MVIVKEARWRAHGLWIVLGAFVIPALARPTLTVFSITLFAAILVSWIQQRRQRASLVIDEDGILIANRRSTHIIPRRGASVEVIHGGRYVLTGDEELDEDLPAGKALYIVPAAPDAEQVHVDAIQGLVPAEFQRVVAEVRSVLRAA